MKQEILDGREVRPMATAPRTKKDLKDEYKARALFGGVGAVKNQVNGMVLLESAVDILTKKNRFEFAKSSGLCIYPVLKADWDLYGAKAFTYEILESIRKPEEQSVGEFTMDMELIKSAWEEKFGKAALY